MTRARLDVLGLLALRGLKDSKVPPGRREARDLAEILAHRGLMVPQDPREFLALLDRQGIRVTKDLRDQLVPPDRRVPREPRESKA